MTKFPLFRSKRFASTCLTLLGALGVLGTGAAGAAGLGLANA